jgi:hypothetical protein
VPFEPGPLRVKQMKLNVVGLGMVLCAVVLGLPVALECWAGRAGGTVARAPVVAPGTTAPAAAHCESGSGVAIDAANEMPPGQHPVDVLHQRD